MRHPTCMLQGKWQCRQPYFRVCVGNTDDMMRSRRKMIIARLCPILERDSSPLDQNIETPRQRQLYTIVIIAPFQLSRSLLIAVQTRGRIPRGSSSRVALLHRSLRTSRRGPGSSSFIKRMAEAPEFVFISPVPRPSAEPPSLCDAWRSAITKYFGDGEGRFKVLEGRLNEIDPALLQCDAMVSPANSFGIMDGG